MSTVIYKKNYVLTTNTGDYKDELLMTSVIDLFQDAAGKHATTIAETSESLKERGYYWILARSRVEFLKDVTINNDVYVKTYQSSIGAASYEREYFLCASNDEVLIKGDSRWCVIDINTGRIVPTSKVSNANDVFEEKAFNESFKKIPPLEKSDISFNYKVVYTDIDHNNHMNNTRYVTPLINYFRRNIKFIEINYLKQSYLDDELKYCLQQVEDNCYFVYIYNCSNEKEELVNKCYVELFEENK